MRYVRWTYPGDLVKIFVHAHGACRDRRGGGRPRQGLRHDVFFDGCDVDRTVKISRNGLETRFDETGRKVMLVYWVEEERSCGVHSADRFLCAGPSVKR